MPLSPARHVLLRPTAEGDVESLYRFGSDEESNRLARTKPRDWTEFRARWTEILADPTGSRTRVVPRVILADGVLAGSVNVSPWEGELSLGYWIAREHWGRGIATRAVALMLSEFAHRPLVATTAGTNLASIVVLRKNGFVEVARGLTPESPRLLARETVTMRLG